MANQNNNRVHKKMGRPKTRIDVKQFEKLCQLQCTLTEIAGFFECSEDTIENWCWRTFNMTFSDVFRQKRSGGLISLRRNQFRLSEKNATMAIFLGKNYLGQKENVMSDDDIVAEDIDAVYDAAGVTNGVSDEK